MSEILAEASRAYSKANSRKSSRTSTQSQNSKSKSKFKSIEERIAEMEEIEEPESLQHQFRWDSKKSETANLVKELTMKIEKLNYDNKVHAMDYAKLLQQQSDERALVAVGALSELVVNNKKEVDQTASRNKKSLEQQINDLAERLDNIEKNKTIDKKQVEKIVDEKVKKMPKQNAMSSERFRKQVAKNDHFREKSSREIIIRGIKNDIENSNPKEIATKHLSSIANIEVRGATFDNNWIKAADFKGKDRKVEDRNTLVVITESNRIRDLILEMIPDTEKRGQDKPLVRPGIAPSDRKELEKVHKQFDELKKQGKLQDGARCKIKGSDGHFWLNQKIFKAKVQGEASKQSRNGSKPANETVELDKTTEKT